MLEIYIRLVAFLGLFGLMIGIFGEPTVLLSSCVLIGFALVAAAITSRKEE